VVRAPDAPVTLGYDLDPLALRSEALSWKGVLRLLQASGADHSLQASDRAPFAEGEEELPGPFLPCACLGSGSGDAG
jgi:hypothetical protein